MAAVDYFLKLDGIEGESADKTHKGEIDILSISWGVSNSGSFHSGDGGGQGKASFQDVSFTKYADKSSPNLFYAAASGKHIAKGEFVARKAGEHPLEYYIWKFENILVSSIQTGGSGGEDRLTDNFTLNFAQVKMEYWTQSKTGAKDKSTNMGWIIPEGAKL